MILVPTWLAIIGGLSLLLQAVALAVLGYFIVRDLIKYGRGDE